MTLRDNDDDDYNDDADDGDVDAYVNSFIAFGRPMRMTKEWTWTVTQ